MRVSNTIKCWTSTTNSRVCCCFFKSCFLLGVWRMRWDQTARFHGNWVEGRSKGLRGCAGSNCTDPAQGTELWKKSGEGENAPGWVNPDQLLFMQSTGTVCFCFSKEAKSHRKSRQPDQGIRKRGRLFPSVLVQNCYLPFISALNASSFNRLQIKVTGVVTIVQHI